MKRHESTPAYNEYPGFAIPEISTHDYEIDVNLWETLAPDLTPPSRAETATRLNELKYADWLAESGAWQNLPTIADASLMAPTHIVDITDTGSEIWLGRTYTGDYVICHDVRIQIDNQSWASTHTELANEIPQDEIEKTVRTYGPEGAFLALVSKHWLSAEMDPEYAEALEARIAAVKIDETATFVDFRKESLAAYDMEG